MASSAASFTAALPTPVKAIQFNNHPFRFLLYLEWGLLAVAIVSALESPPARMARRGPPPPGMQGEWPVGPSPLMAVIPLVIFGLMGLYLPLKPLPRLGHALGQILLIMLASVTAFNGGRIFPFVYLVLVIRSCLMFGLVGRVSMAIIAFGLFLAGLQFRVRSIASIGRRLPPRAQDRLQDFIFGLQLNFVVLFGLSLLLVVLLINALLTERQSQRRLQQANHELRQSAHEIEKLAMDQERSRIARDIHDALGHSLTALNIQLESALKLSAKDPPRAQKFLQEAKRLGSQSLQEVRQSVATLRQDPLAGNSLEEAITRLLKDIEQTVPVDINAQIHLGQPLPSNLEAILYRIVQEGLTNIVKHANASYVDLQLVGAVAVVTLTLIDDGVGFDLTQARTGFGLQSMRDRAQAVGGTFIVTSPISRSAGRSAGRFPGRSVSRQAGGTRIQVSLPVPR